MVALSAPSYVWIDFVSYHRRTNFMMILKTSNKKLLNARRVKHLFSSFLVCIYLCILVLGRRRSNKRVVDRSIFFLLTIYKCANIFLLIIYTVSFAFVSYHVETELGDTKNGMTRRLHLMVAIGRTGLEMDTLIQRNILIRKSHWFVLILLLISS